MKFPKISNRWFSLFILLFICHGELSLFCECMAEESNIALVIHGGAGGALPRDGRETKEAALDAALDAGYAVLEDGGSAICAVEAAIRVLEDSPLFNAGRGAVLNAQGEAELDASIMDGSNLEAGAVGGVTVVKNPIRAAIAVKDQSPHVLLVGEGADAFASAVGLEIVPRDYFITDSQKQKWLKNRDKGFKPDLAVKRMATPAAPGPDDHLGTVGAVALDKNGNIAAGTSTGGMANKSYGRIGDSPIIGAGTYADNETCGISCTGHGEFFIRYAVASDISARMKYKGSSLAEAAREVIHDRLLPVKGYGGIIGLDSKGNVVVEYNTTSMTRAWIDAKGKRVIEPGTPASQPGQ